MTEFQATLVQHSDELAQRARIAVAFGRSAHTYDSFADLQRQVVDRLSAQLPVDKQVGAALDLGCGTGYGTAKLHQSFPAAKVLALDLALPMLQQAKLHLLAELPTLLCADAQCLPFGTAAFDVVLSSLTLQWCKPSAVFAELVRVLKPGGTALISTLGPKSLQEFRAAWATVDNERHGNVFVTAAELLSAAASSGLVARCEEALLTRYYGSLAELGHELKGLGANVVLNRKQQITTSAAQFKQASRAFSLHRQAAGIPVSWQVFYFTVHKPLQAEQ